MVFRESFPELADLETRKKGRPYGKYHNLLPEVLWRFLFEGMENRDLDERVLGRDPKSTHGKVSSHMMVKYGITGKHKGALNGMSMDQVAHYLPSEPDYEDIYDLLSRYNGGHGVEGCVSEEFGMEKFRVVRVRVNQGAFRNKILDAYGGRCCITGISNPWLLRASHIKPWCESNPVEKFDVRNGLCLDSLHDAAFDTGLITVDPRTLEVRLSRGLEDCFDEDTFQSFFGQYDGREISCPDPDDGPLPEYLEYHRANVFGKKTVEPEDLPELKVRDLGIRYRRRNGWAFRPSLRFQVLNTCSR